MKEPFILFKVAGATYAVRSSQVQQIELIEHITHVPNAAEFIEGVVQVRGKVIPVINLRSRFRMARIDRTTASRLVIIQVDRRLVGMEVDSAREFIYLSPEDILPPPDTLSGPGTEYLEGVITLENRLVLVIQLDALLNPVEREALKNETAETPLLNPQDS